MGLQKSIVSTRTGVTLGYHEVTGVNFNGSRISASVASYADQAAKEAGKTFAEMNSYSLPYDGSAINSTPQAYAQAQLLTLPQFSGAVAV